MQKDKSILTIFIVLFVCGITFAFYFGMFSGFILSSTGLIFEPNEWHVVSTNRVMGLVFAVITFVITVVSIILLVLGIVLYRRKNNVLE